MLRLEVPSVMEIDVLQQDFKEGESGYDDDIWQNPDFRHAITHFIEQQLEEDNPEALLPLEEAEQEYKDLASKRRQKKDYPLQTTMGYNVRKVQYLDWVDVQKKRYPNAPIPAFEDVTEDHYCAVDQVNEIDILQGLDGQSASGIMNDPRIAEAINIFLNLEHGPELDARKDEVRTLEEEDLALTRRGRRDKRYDPEAGQVHQLGDALYQDYVDAWELWKPTVPPPPKEEVTELEYAHDFTMLTTSYLQLSELAVLQQSALA